MTLHVNRTQSIAISLLVIVQILKLEVTTSGSKSVAYNLKASGGSRTTDAGGA